MLKKIRVCYFCLYWRKRLMIKNAFYLWPRITHSIHFLLLSLCGQCFCFLFLGVVSHLTCLSKPLLGMQMSIVLAKIICRGRLILLGCTVVNKKQQHCNRHLFPLYFRAMGNISRLFARACGLSMERMQKLKSAKRLNMSLLRPWLHTMELLWVISQLCERDICKDTT